MAKSLKPLPKNAAEISQEQVTPYLIKEGKPVSDTVFSKNRGKDISFKNDTVKDVSIGLEDLDNAILYYFENIIKPSVIQNNQRVVVPVIYGSPERWKSVQADGFYRDNNGRLMVPLIMFKRENISKNRELGNKLDGNKSHLYQVVGSKYNIRNVYDKFSLINNKIPSEQYYITTVPDYVTVTYSCIVFTDFVEQNNKLIEAIEFSSDSYWGDPNRWKFKTRIDDFTTTTILEDGTDRAVKTSFNITLNGYIIPNTINKDLAVARSKFYTTSQVIFDLEVIDANGMITNTDKVKFNSKNATNSTSFIGSGVNILNNNVTNINIVNGSDVLTYINTNITKTAIYTNTTTATISNSRILSAPLSLPSTNKNSFYYFINGQNIPSTYIISITQVGLDVVVVFDIASLGYSLSSSDEIFIIGKFE